MPIDTTLFEHGGVLRPKAIASNASVEISTGGAGTFVRMTAHGQSYALRWPTPLPKPMVKGGVVTYTDAAGAGADLVVTVLPTGFRHDVVLRQRPSKPLELRIGVESDGLTLSEGKGGRLLLKGKDKKLVASAPQPIMWDGSAKGRLPLARHAVIDTEVVSNTGRTELVLKPDHAFLSDSKTVYPVRVDPTTTLPSNNDLSVLSTDTADSPAYPTSNALPVGVQTGQKMRALLRFDTTSLVGKTVTDARLSMSIISAQTCGASVGQGVQAARVTGAWDENNLYWANKPAFTTEDAQINKTSIDCASTQTPTEWNITGISQDWAAGAANHGLVLKAPTENTTIEWRMYASSDDTEWNAPPKLVVTTSAPASSPTIANFTITPAQDVAGTTVTSSLTPQLAATVADTAGGNLTSEFEVDHDPAATGQGTGQIWAGASSAVASGSQAAVGVPAGKLADGWKVRWRARAVNAAAATASAWSSWQTATVDVPNPTVGAFQVTLTGGERRHRVHERDPDTPHHGHRPGRPASAGGVRGRARPGRDHAGHRPDLDRRRGQRRIRHPGQHRRPQRETHGRVEGALAGPSDQHRHHGRLTLVGLATPNRGRAGPGLRTVRRRLAGHPVRAGGRNHCHPHPHPSSADPGE
ncbi:DNRLRE domain-containing protein [Nonomuraea antimicrobica]